MKTLTTKIVKELRANVDKGYRDHGKEYFLGQDERNALGVRLPIIRKIGRVFYKELPETSKRIVLEYCDDLLETGYYESGVIAFQWAERQLKQMNEKDFSLLERWLRKYVHDWAACDDLCGGVLGRLLAKYPTLVQQTIPWRLSKNRWLKRASAVALIYGVRKEGIFLQEIMETAEALIQDKDDLVQKGYGWALKEASQQYPKEVLKFVTKKTAIMPRTALRYAIEKYPENTRKKVLRA